VSNGQLLNEWMGKVLSEQQLAAAMAPLEPGVIVAGAGTGKTTVMTARVVWLVANGLVRPDQVLGLTFTTKATAELASRVRAALQRVRERPRLGDDLGEPAISTYHSFAHRLVSEYGALVGAEPAARVLTDAALRQLVLDVVCSTRHQFEGPVSNPKSLTELVIDLDSALAEHAIDPVRLLDFDATLIGELLPHKQQAIGDTMIQTAQSRRDCAQLVIELREQKRRLMMIDFADQLRWAAKIANDFPKVAAEYKDRYRVVLLDEYQDTSVTQRQLMQQLFGQGHPVTAVGDPLQAIYGFRGASVHNIEQFSQHFPVSPANSTATPRAPYPLYENRRSRQSILDVANHVAEPLYREHLSAHPLAAAPPGPAAPGVVRCALLETEVDEAEWVADQIESSIAANHDYSDVTILLRAMSKVALLREALTAREIPVEIVGVEGLFALPEVVEIISVLRLLHEPAANSDCTRLLAGPRWRIGPRDLALLGARAGDLAGRHGTRRGLNVDDSLDEAVADVDPVDLVSLSDALDDLGSTPFSAAARERLSAFSAELRGLRRYVGEPLGDLVRRILDVTGFEAELMVLDPAISRQRLAAVEAFVSLASEFHDLEGRSSLGAFLRFISDAHRFDKSPDADLPNASSSVRIMSIHKAKGLEFPVVILPFLDDRTFPTVKRTALWPKSARAIPYSIRHEPEPSRLPGFASWPIPKGSEFDRYNDAARELDRLDETRLAYVAITRAETSLYACASWWPKSGKSRHDPGRFLLDIQQACLSGAGEVDVWTPEPADDQINPLSDVAEVPWPVPINQDFLSRRQKAAELVRSMGPQVDDVSSDPRIEQWDRDLVALLSAAERDHATERSVALPESLSTTELQHLLADEASFIKSLVRPLPQKPSTAARRGTRFHAWVEAQFGQQPLLGPEDLPGAADADIDSDAEFEQMQQRFLELPYAALDPFAIEEPFAITLGGRLFTGRIDAIFRHPDRNDPTLWRWEVVDWKTNREANADPLQLAVYRIAWAEKLGVELDQVDAAFAYVRLGEVHQFGAAGAPLPDRGQLERMITTDANSQ